jgi:membrane protease YdiL (CAAX protease family)
MTAVAADTRRPTAVATGVGVVTVAAVGTALLAVRPSLVARVEHPATVLVVLFALLAVAAALLPIPRALGDAPHARGPVTVVGVVVVVGARVVTSGRAPGALGLATVLLGTLAAVSEELWFRRFLYGLLAPGGAVLAVTGTAVLFALVHVPVYGWGVLPLDVAAGLVLGWQRHATGSWLPAAVAHAVANVVVLL